MATRIETLLTQIVTNLGADVSIDATKVYRNRVAALNDTELPGYNVVLGADTPLGEFGATNLSFIDWEQAVFIDCYERTILANQDAVFLDMRRNIHRALMADYTQGLSFVTTTIPFGADEPTVDNEGERKNTVYRTNWIFQIRTSIDDLET
jgi:hypothetical protein